MIKLFLDTLCAQRTCKGVAIDILINAAEVTEVISMQQLGECKYLQMSFLQGEGDCWAVISMDQS